MNRKQAKSLLAYGLLAFVLVLTSVVLVKAITSFSAGDSDLSISYNLVTEAKADRAYTPHCFTDCHLPFCFTPSGNLANSIPVTDKDITQSLDFAEGSDQSILRESGVDYLTAETYTVDVPVYGTCQSERLNNETGQNETYSYNCLTGYSQEERTREVWKPLKDVTQLQLEAGKEQCFDIWGKLEPRLHSNFAVDIIPHVKLQNREFSLDEYAWWTGANVTYKRLLAFNTTTNTQIKVPYLINGTNGVNGSEIWTLPEENFSTSTNYTEWLYYNNFSVIYVVNKTENTQRSHEVVNGTAQSYLPRNVWRNVIKVHHNNRTDYSQLDQDATDWGSPIYHNAGGAIGGYVQVDGDDGLQYYSFTTYDNYSWEFWINLTSCGVDNNILWGLGSGARGVQISDSSCTIRGIGGNPYSWTIFKDGIVNANLSTAQWIHVVVASNGSGPSTGSNGTNLYVNGRFLGSINSDISGITQNASWGYDATDNAYYMNGGLDEMRIWNKTLTADEAKALYEVSAQRRSELGVQETESGSATEIDGDNAIISGITTSLANASVPYYEQQIYTRNSTGQALGRFDVVAVLGNQRWAFNYVSSNENTSGLTNMTSMAPALYIWENQNLTSTQITDQVKALIDSTKQ